MLITTIVLAFYMQSCAQQSGKQQVPEEVQIAFKAKFPKAKKVEWEREDDSEWEAEFKWNGKKYSAAFNNDGEWLETEHEIEESEIPSNIRAVLDENFSDYEIEESEMAETANGQAYELEIEVDEEEFEVIIDSNGNLTKKAESEEDEENDED